MKLSRNFVSDYIDLPKDLTIEQKQIIKELYNKLNK